MSQAMPALGSICCLYSADGVMNSMNASLYAETLVRAVSVRPGLQHGFSMPASVHEAVCFLRCRLSLALTLLSSYGIIYQ